MKRSGIIDGAIYHSSLIVKTNVIASKESVILVDATDSQKFITLPNAEDKESVIYYIKKIDSSSNKVTIRCSINQKINDQDTFDMYVQHDGTQVISDGTNWQIIGGGGGAVYTTITVSSVTYSAGPFTTILCDTTSNDITVTLPSATSRKNSAFHIKNIATGAVTIDTVSGNIDGSASKALNTQYDAYTCVSDGSNWYLI